MTVFPRPRPHDVAAGTDERWLKAISEMDQR
jgi:hypothetical protein